MTRSTNKAINAKLGILVGIGGIHCPCCTHFRLRITKRLWNRMYRRVSKQRASREYQDA